MAPIKIKQLTSDKQKCASAGLAICKVKTFCLSTPLRHKYEVQIQGHLQSIWTYAPGGGEWSTLRPGRFTSGKKHPYQLNRRIVGPQNPSELVGKINSPCPCQNSSPDWQSHSLVSTLLSNLTHKVMLPQANFSFPSLYAAAVVLNQCKINSVQP